MAETGVLKPDARVELLDGQIIDMSPIGPFHGSMVKRLNRLFNNLAAGRFLVSVQDPVLLDEHSEPQPDLMLLKPAHDDYSTRHPGPEDVLLLVEVADTSLAYDRGEKLTAYGRAGIREVWIVNLAEQAIETYREPHYAGYGITTVQRTGDKANPLAFPDVSVDVTQLFCPINK
ncbi:MAG: putative dioxygenase [Pedosphaera sp.]|nr:putative dioxygenase [Pedosphaera sp.]